METHKQDMLDMGHAFTQRPNPGLSQAATEVQIVHRKVLSSKLGIFGLLVVHVYIE